MDVKELLSFTPSFLENTMAGKLEMLSLLPSWKSGRTFSDRKVIFFFSCSLLSSPIYPCSPLAGRDEGRWTGGEGGENAGKRKK